MRPAISRRPALVVALSLALAAAPRAARADAQAYTADQAAALKTQLSSYAAGLSQLADEERVIGGTLADLSQSHDDAVAQHASDLQPDAADIAGRLARLSAKASAGVSSFGDPDGDGLYHADLGLDAGSQEVASISDAMQQLKKDLESGPKGPFAGLARRQDGVRDELGKVTDSFEAALPAGTAARSGALPPCPPGWDPAKWNDPTHTTPKYVIGRIVAAYDHTPAGLKAALPKIQAAFPGAAIKAGKGDILSIPGLGDIDVIQAAGDGGKAWQWLPVDVGSGPGAQAAAPPPGPGAGAPPAGSPGPQASPSPAPHASAQGPTPRELNAACGKAICSEGDGPKGRSSSSSAAAAPAAAWYGADAVTVAYNPGGSCPAGTYSLSVTFPGGKSAPGCAPRCGAGHPAEYSLGQDARADIACR